MNNKYLFYLKISYSTLIIVYVLINLFNFPFEIDTALLLFAISFIAATHMMILMNSKKMKINKILFILGILWVAKYVMFCIYNVSFILFDIDLPMIMGWIDVYLLLIIAAIVSISFICRFPFWFEKTTKKTYLVLGIFSSLVLFGFILSLALNDYIYLLSKR